MLVFHRVAYKNFLSTGNQPIEIHLDEAPTSCIIGSNGFGKSAFIDAITFALFGKPFRNIKKQQLVNSVNQSDCVVELEFTVGSTRYLVRRGLKPAVFEVFINGTMINQESTSKDYQKVLENLTKLNYKSFRNIVVLGSASYVPFMSLSALDRRDIIEDLLDIKIFSAMNFLLKSRISGSRLEQDNLSSQIRVIEDKIKFYENHIASVLSKQAENVQEIQDKIDASVLDLEEKKKKIEKLQTRSRELVLTVADKDKQEREHNELVRVRIQLEGITKKNAKEIEFFDTNKSCPTCHQDIAEEFKSQIVQQTKQKKEEIDQSLVLLGTHLEKYEIRLAEINRNAQEIRNIETTIQQTAREALIVTKHIEEYQKQIVQIKQGGHLSAEEQAKYQELKNSRDLTTARIEGNQINQKYQNYASLLLKDSGIKASIIQNYLPSINELINRYLSELNFYVSFHLDENFNEKIQSRFRDEFSYESFSEGEKFRINIALLLTWREIARRKNSINTNLLIMDEVFDSSLDADGIEDFIRLIQSMGDKTNIFIISHKRDQIQDKFSRVLEFSKVGDFSKLEIL